MPHTKASVEAAFKVFDTNGDGCISPDEFRAVLMHPVGGRKLSEEDVNELFGHLDENGDGKLDMAEMAKALGSGLISMPASSESRSTPEQATAKAMADEVKRVAGLGAAEQQQLGTPFVEAEAIFEALEKPGQPTMLLRASWLMSCTPSKLLKRGDHPPEAYIGAAELRRIYADATFGSREQDARPLPFIALSHFWRTQQHPDPDGVTLEIVVAALKARWPEFTKLNVHDLGIFVDYCSLFQHPRTKEQEPIFKASLGGINLWYAHRLTTVWLVTEGRDLTKGLGYHEKGWTTFEHRLALMIKPANTSVFSAWPQAVDLGQRGPAQIEFSRPPPSEPLAFFEGHECGSKEYTSGADRDAVVAPKFREATFELLGGSRELNFNKLGWGDNEARQLSGVLLLCGQLLTLTLVGNKIGAVGAAAIGEALRVNASLTQVLAFALIHATSPPRPPSVPTSTRP
jgi:hypothetical protein